MAKYVLVHGAWHGGWCWQRVSKILRNKGHDVFTPTLTGLGERAHLAGSEINLECHIEDIIGVIRMEELNDIVLCGHSYGGQVITPVLDRYPHLFRAGIWLDAFIPENGQSIMDGWPKERVEKVLQQANTTGDGWKIEPLSPDYFGVIDPKDAAWVARRCVPQPIKTFSQAVSLTGAWKTVPKKLYLLAKNHPNSNFNRFSENLSRQADWDVRTIASGHDIMIDNPNLLAKILMELV